MKKTLFTSRFTVVQACEMASYFLAAVALCLVLYKGMLVALFSGLLTHALITTSAPLLGKRVRSQTAKYIVVTLMSAAIVGAIVLITWAIVAFFQGDVGKLQFLIQKLADIIDESKTQLPGWLSTYLPSSANELRDTLVHWLRDHANIAPTVGAEVTMIAVHWLFGLIIGALTALRGSTHPHEHRLERPLATALLLRCARLAKAFRVIVFAQIRISCINAAITAVFLFVVLPAFSVHLPFARALVVIALIVGILPVIGNTISNSILVILGLSHSLTVAIAAVTFMFFIHKLEYFLNAKIMGNSIQSKTWEMLLSMLVMEAIFGLPGVVAAPVFYAYIKDELQANGLI